MTEKFVFPPTLLVIVYRVKHFWFMFLFSLCRDF